MVKATIAPLQETSVTGDTVADARGQFSWALFEFARSPYLSLIYIFIFGPYFANTVIGDPVRGQELWSFANTVVGLIVALIAPFLGAISDIAGPRKPWLVLIVLLMSAGCISLWWAMPGADGGLPVSAILFVVVLLAGCFLLSEVFHNAMLPSIVSRNRIGSLSGYGIACNNLGSMITLSLMLVFVALPATGIFDLAFIPDNPILGLNPALYEHSRITGPFAGVWLLFFTLPLLLWTPDRTSRGKPMARAVREGMRQLKDTIRQARKFKNIMLYLFARMLYNDGKVAAVAYSGIYGAGVFGWQMQQLLLAALILTPFSIFGGIAGGYLDNRLGSKKSIQISIGATIVSVFLAVSVSPDQIFFFIPYTATMDNLLWGFPYFNSLPEISYLCISTCLAISVTAAFTNSRTMMARIAPPSMINQFYGLYALSGTATAFLGHLMVGLFTGYFHSQRVGYASIIILLTLGLVFMYWVREEPAPDIQSE